VKTWRLVPVAAVALLMLAGCTHATNVQAANDKLCSRVADMDGTVTQMAALDPSTPNVAQLRALRLKLAAEYKDVQDAAKDADSVRIDPITQAYQTVVKASNSVNDTNSFQAAEAPLGDAAGQFSDARTALNSSAGC
jgi:hypothetical protein